LKDKKVLVTGADGFIGSHLTEKLVKKGARVRALSLYNSFNNWGWLEDVSCLSDIEVVTGDIRDSDVCNEITNDIDFVFHLAALIAIPYSYQAPHSYVETNILGTLNMCRASLEKVERILHTSTSEVYGTAQYVPIDESHPLQPQSPYSASKIGADAIAMSHYHSFNLPLVIARPFNTYGPRQSSRAVIPTIISQLASGKKEVMLGDTTPTRDFTFVEDTCQAMINLAESEKSIGETINIGSNEEISIADLFELINKLMGTDAKLKKEEQRIWPEGSEVFRLKCDNSKIYLLTDFKPSYEIEKGLEKTISWFTNPENLKKYKTEIYNV
jgi:NAD dependent epimerase/dehydratase